MINFRSRTSWFFWAASSLILAGKAVEVYNPRQLYQAEARVSHPQHHRIWAYPPTYMLIILPLSFLPFLASLVFWGTATLAGYVSVIKRIAPHPLTVWLTLAFPPSFHNLVRGQNGFLSGIFFGSGLLILDYRPLAAGLLLGLMVFKPHLAILIPFALVAGRHWQAIAGFALSALGMILLSIAAFGTAVWSVFLQFTFHEGKSLLDPADMASNLMPTVYFAGGMLGLNPSLALGVHWTVVCITTAIALWTWYQRASLRVRASTLIIATLLFSPRLLIYDYTLLAIPLAFLGTELITVRLTPGRALIFASGWLMPFLAPILAAKTHIQIGLWHYFCFCFTFYMIFLQKFPIGMTEYN